MTNIADNPFQLQTHEYQRDIDPMRHYLDHQSLGLSKMRGIPIEQARAIIIKMLKPGGAFAFKDPTITYLQRKENGDREKKVSTFLSYIKQSIRDRELISPSLATYLHPDVKVSILSEFMDYGVAKRNKAKKAQHEAEAVGDHFMAEFKKCEQTGAKRTNNAGSGAQCTESTPLFNPTAHSTLTSNCRSTAGNGNANNEKLLAGNRHYWSSEVVVNNITSIVNLTDLAAVGQVVEKYNLHIPSVQDVMQVITYSSDLYWRNEKKLAFIRELVSSLEPIERAAFVYVSDLYHLRLFNPDFMRVFLTRLASKCYGEMSDDKAYEIIRLANEDVLNFAQLVCRKETSGHGKKHEQMGHEARTTIASTILNIQNVITEHADLIRALLTTKNMPASMAYFPSSIRRVVVTGDTDSTIFTVQEWVLWFKQKISFDDEACSIATAMSFFASATITHLLAMMSANFGVVQKRLYQIAMKNEFYYPIYLLTNLGKHYAALMGAKEGAVYKDMVLDIKGVYLKSSTLPADIRTTAVKMMEDIFKDLMTQGQIKITKYIGLVSSVERSIVQSITAGESTYLRAGQIKDAETYTNEESKSPYQMHHFWNQVFGEKYGTMPPPPYDTLKFSLTTQNKSDTKAWIASIEDPQIRHNLEVYLARNNKSHLTTLNLPTSIMMNSGFPKEIMGVIDMKRIVSDICKIFYILLEVLGVYTQGEKKIKRLISDYYQEEVEIKLQLPQLD